MPRKGELGKVQKIRTQAKVQAEVPESPAPAEEAPPTPSKWRGRRAQVGKLEEVGEVTRVISYRTVGPDGWRGQAIDIGRGGAGQKETPTNSGEERLPGRSSQRPEK